MSDKVDIKKIIKEIQQEHGLTSIKGLDSLDIVDHPCLPTGLLSLDHILGKGIPVGRVVEIFGTEGSGKTSLCLQIIAQTQKNNGVGVFVDVEHALNVEYARSIGVDLDNLLISQPDSGEEAFAIIESLIKTDKIDIIVVDSAAALIPQQEASGDYSDQNIGLQARLLSKSLRKINALLGKSKTSLVFVNQLRHLINNFSGPSETTPGGRSLKFYSSIRIEVRKQERIKTVHGDGILVKVKVIKNKFASPFQETFLKLIFGKGFDSTDDLIEFALKKKVLYNKGPWYYFEDDTKICQGKLDLIDAINNNENQLQDKLKEKLGL